MMPFVTNEHVNAPATAVEAPVYKKETVQSNDEPSKEQGFTEALEETNKTEQQSTPILAGEQPKEQVTDKSSPIVLYNPFKQTDAATQQIASATVESENPILQQIMNDPAMIAALNAPAEDTKAQTEVPELSQLMQSTAPQNMEATSENPVEEAVKASLQQNQQGTLQEPLQKPAENVLNTTTENTVLVANENKIADQSVLSQVALASHTKEPATQPAAITIEDQPTPENFKLAPVANNMNGDLKDNKVINPVAVQNPTVDKQDAAQKSQLENQAKALQQPVVQNTEAVETAVIETIANPAVNTEAVEAVALEVKPKQPTKTAYDNRYDQEQVSDVPKTDAVAPVLTAQAITPSQTTAATTLPLNETQVSNPMVQANLEANIEAELEAQFTDLDVSTSTLEENPFEWLESIQRNNTLVTKANVMKAQQGFMMQPNQPAHEQIAFQMRKAADSGIEQMRLQLSPASLGHVEMNMSIAGDGTVQAVLAVERHDTYEWLKKDMANLEQMLADSSLDTDSGSLSLEYRDRQQQAKEQNNDWQDGKTIRETVAVETTETAAPRYQPIISSTAVDVKV